MEGINVEIFMIHHSFTGFIAFLQIERNKNKKNLQIYFFSRQFENIFFIGKLKKKLGF